MWVTGFFDWHSETLALPINNIWVSAQSYDLDDFLQLLCIFPEGFLRIVCKWKMNYPTKIPGIIWDLRKLFFAAQRASEQHFYSQGSGLWPPGVRVGFSLSYANRIDRVICPHKLHSGAPEAAGQQGTTDLSRQCLLQHAAMTQGIYSFHLDDDSKQGHNSWRLMTA
jgi:hypothetical protein